MSSCGGAVKPPKQNGELGCCCAPEGCAEGEGDDVAEAKAPDDPKPGKAVAPGFEAPKVVDEPDVGVGVGLPNVEFCAG